MPNYDQEHTSRQSVKMEINAGQTVYHSNEGDHDNKVVINGNLGMSGAVQELARNLVSVMDQRDNATRSHHQMLQEYREQSEIISRLTIQKRDRVRHTEDIERQLTRAKGTIGELRLALQKLESLKSVPEGGMVLSPGEVRRLRALASSLTTHARYRSNSINSLLDRADAVRQTPIIRANDVEDDEDDESF